MVDLGPLPHLMTYQVRPQELGPNRRLTFPAMVNLLQDAAWYSAATLGASVAQLHQRGIAWVLSRLVWKSQSALPTMGESIVIETYPSGMQRSFVFRDFKVWGSQGRLLGTATSTWVVMDLLTRKMVPVEESIQALIHPPAGVLPLPRASDRWKDPATWTRTAPIQIGWHDLDLNGHVNHSRYLAWISESLGESLLGESNRSWDVIFRGEATRGEQLISESVLGPLGSTLHRLCRGDDVLVRAKSSGYKGDLL